MDPLVELESSTHMDRGQVLVLFVRWSEEFPPRSRRQTRQCLRNHSAPPAAAPEAQAHWKLNPPRCPVTSTTSPIKNNPGIFRLSIVLAESSSVSTPPAVTSAFSYPSVPAGTIVHACACCSRAARAAFVHAGGACRSSQRSTNRAGRVFRNSDRTAVRVRGLLGSRKIP